MTAMNRADVQAWLDRYVEAWRTNDRSEVQSLFTDDATYGYRPWDSDEHTLRGRDAIVASWLEEPDEPGSWDAHYEPFAIEDDRAVALGWSRYAASGDQRERLYHNAYVHEFYMLQDGA
jgi:hypothetical protein